MADGISVIQSRNHTRRELSCVGEKELAIQLVGAPREAIVVMAGLVAPSPPSPRTTDRVGTTGTTASSSGSRASYYTEVNCTFSDAGNLFVICSAVHEASAHIDCVCYYTASAVLAAAANEATTPLPAAQQGYYRETVKSDDHAATVAPAMALPDRSYRVHPYPTSPESIKGHTSLAVGVPATCTAALEGCWPDVQAQANQATCKALCEAAQRLHAAGCSEDVIAEYCSTSSGSGNSGSSRSRSRVSPHYSVSVGPQSDAMPSFVWFTSVADRQTILPGNNVPSTSREKDTSWTSFDLAAPTLVTVQLLNTTALRMNTAAVLPSSSGITTSTSL